MLLRLLFLRIQHKGVALCLGVNFYTCRWHRFPLYSICFCLQLSWSCLARVLTSSRGDLSKDAKNMLSRYVFLYLSL